MNRTTAAILCAAGSVVAASATLTRTSQGMRPPAPRSQQVSQRQPAPEPPACGSELPARQAQRFAHGELRAALSASHLLRGSGGEMHMAVDLTADRVAGQDRPPLNLALVIDRSGSMAGDKLAFALQAARGLVQRLDARDQLSLVQYDDDADVLVPLRAADAEGKASALRALAAITDRGGTNLHGGLVLGRDQLLRAPQDRRVNRLILLSDGQANVGVVDQPTLAQIAREAAHRGVRVTTVGLGLDYNEDLMEALAENGRGNYHYAAQAAALEPIFTAEFRSLQATVAQNVELRLTPLCDGTEVSEVLGHDSHRDGRTLVVPLTDLAGADQRRLLVRLRAADGGPARTAGRTGLVTVQLAYTDASTGRRVDSQVGLAVELTDDPALAERGIDRDVMEQVLAVHSARRLREASEAYQRGEVAQAQQVLAETRSTIAENAMRYKLSTQFARAADAELAEVNAGVAAFAPASPEGKQLIKGSKAAARDKAKKR